MLRADMIKYWKVTHGYGDVDYENILQLKGEECTRGH